jgi:hypothetical protein
MVATKLFYGMDSNVDIIINRELPFGFQLANEEMVYDFSFHVEIKGHYVNIDLTNAKFVPVLLMEDNFREINVKLGPQHKELTIVFREPYGQQFIELMRIESKSEVTLRFENKDLFIFCLSGSFSEIISSNPGKLSIENLQTIMDERQMVQSIFRRCLNVHLFLEKSPYLFLKDHPLEHVHIVSKFPVVYVLSSLPYEADDESTLAAIEYPCSKHTCIKIVEREQNGGTSANLVKHPNYGPEDRYFSLDSLFCTHFSNDYNEIKRELLRTNILRDLQVKLPNVVVCNAWSDDSTSFSDDQSFSSSSAPSDSEEKNLERSCFDPHGHEQKQVDVDESTDLTGGRKRKRALELDPEHQQTDGPNGGPNKKLKGPNGSPNPAFNQANQGSLLEQEEDLMPNSAPNSSNNTNANIRPANFDDMNET